MNGVYSAIPYVLQTIVVFFSGSFADLIRNRILSTTNTRKFCYCSCKCIEITDHHVSIAVVLQAVFLVFCVYFGNTKPTALLLLTLAVGVGGLSIAGHMVNIIDMAPRFAGEIMGIVNTAGTIPGIIGPIIAKNIAHSVGKVIIFIFASVLFSE